MGCTLTHMSRKKGLLRPLYNYINSNYFSGQTETVSVRFRPKMFRFLAFRFSFISVFQPFRPFRPILAYFGYYWLFWPPSTPMLVLFNISRIKKLILCPAEIKHFGRNKAFWPKLVFRPKFWLFEGDHFRFRPFGQKTVSFAH